MTPDSSRNIKTPIYLSELIILKSMIINKYEYYAKQAKKEGFEQISAIFTETLTQKKNHIKTIYRLLESQQTEVTIEQKFSAIGSTIENLTDSLLLENELIRKIENFNTVIWAEGRKKEHTKLKLFLQISEFYVERFSKLLENIKQDKVFKKDQKVKWICRKCGLIYESTNALHNCPGCEHPQAYFEMLAENY
jgi:rubrerythrin